jgi:hypothetical protein
MFFTFWTNSEGLATAEQISRQIGPTIEDWSAQFPDFVVFTDEDVSRILRRRGRSEFELYHKVKFPACKADVARLLLLLEYGGLYIDAHVGTGQAHCLTRVLEKLANYELILFDLTWKHSYLADLWIMNTVLAARRAASVVDLLVDSCFKNLEMQYRKESTNPEYVPFNIYTLTGAADIQRNLLNLQSTPILIKDEFKSRVHVERLLEGVGQPFALYKHYHYRVPGLHWSERQKIERLFWAGGQGPASLVIGGSTRHPCTIKTNMAPE